MQLVRGEASSPSRGFLVSGSLRPTDGPVSEVVHESVIMLADDVAESGFSLPFQSQVDRVAWGDHVAVITNAVERSVAGVVIAYELRVTGS